jgi:hypothetical protein
MVAGDEPGSLIQASPSGDYVYKEMSDQPPVGDVK